MKKKKIEKIELDTPDMKGEIIDQLREVVPGAFSEGKLDLEKLKELVGNGVEERPERYSFTWAGKRDAVRILQVPSRAALKPCREESIDFEKTKHLFIEGENLEVLKLLYKAYAGRVKMIYIDPPYNTGKDFIYPDNFADPLANYLRMTGQTDEEGNLLTSNPETSGRYHSAWLSMMYPRLFIARQLLSDDGVIFVSIDENEVYNLKMVMNEVFGEENHISDYIWKARSGQAGTIGEVSWQHEYIICYGRVSAPSLKMEVNIKEGGTKNDDKGKYHREQLRQWGQADRRIDRPLMFYPIPTPEGNQVFPIKEDGSDGRWRVGRKKALELLKKGELDFEYDGKCWKVYKKIREGTTTFSAYGTVLENIGTTADGTKAIQELFGFKVMDYPKPISLITFLINLVILNNDEAIVMDFFAGSSTTAHSVINYNIKNNISLRYIMIQIPEPTIQGSIAYTKSYKTISDIGKGRIQRIIKKIKDECEEDLVSKTQELDLGFRVFKLSESHFKRWTGTEEKDANELNDKMKYFFDPLVPGWKVEDVLWEIAIKEGLSLTGKIEKIEDIKSNDVWKITDEDKEQSLLVCLDKKIDPKTPDKLNLSKEDLFICRDIALTDELAANLALQCRLKVL